MHPSVAALFLKCRTCGHGAFNHVQSRSNRPKRTHCCFGDSKSICQCKLFVAPEAANG